ncbi:DUF2970 domain-containing protein [Thalassotalea mangrovi]|uniref:DUF2970 domain-containing protein n=1 Tax=Thalassotalea mangrovi TaxID=2572245 RepID=UPI002482B1D8|nr:DUF2970 domain-containing protein [Thalassotalea mangrovi]
MSISTQQKSGLWLTFKSVVAAMFGVQSDKNRVQDFQQGNALRFIVIGIIAVAIFVLSLVGIVWLVLPG